MREEALNKIDELEHKIYEMRNQQDEIRRQESEYERSEEARKWKEDNARCIPVCKNLLGKAFTFGDEVVHHEERVIDGSAVEYDYVLIYFVQTINYRDKSKVCMRCRRMYSGDDDASICNYDLFLSFSECEDGWYVTHSNTDKSYGKLHVLTEEELRVAIDFWKTNPLRNLIKTMMQPVEGGWRCGGEKG